MAEVNAVARISQRFPDANYIRRGRVWSNCSSIPNYEDSFLEFFHWIDRLGTLDEFHVKWDSSIHEIIVFYSIK